MTEFKYGRDLFDLLYDFSRLKKQQQKIFITKMDEYLFASPGLQKKLQVNWLIQGSEGNDDITDQHLVTERARRRHGS